MTIGKSPIFWELRGSIGTQKYTTRYNGEIIGSMKGKKNPVYKDKDKQEDRDLRMAGYGGCGKVTRVLLEVITKGFAETKRKQSAPNLFMIKNVKKLCRAIRPKRGGPIIVEYDFGVMEVAHGSLDDASVTAKVDLEKNMVTLTQEAEVIPGGLSREDDQLYACIFSAGVEGGEEGDNMKALWIRLKSRGERGETLIPIPAKWNKLMFFVFVFATSSDGRYSSRSSRLYPPLSAEELAIIEAVEAWEAVQLRMAIRGMTATREQMASMEQARKEVKKMIKALEEEGVRQGKSLFEAKLSALEESTRYLDGVVNMK